MFFSFLTTGGNIGSILEAFLGLIEAIKNGTLFQPSETNAPPELAQAAVDVVSGTVDFASNIGDLFEQSLNLFDPFLDDTARSVVAFTIGLWAILFIARILGSVVKILTGGLSGFISNIGG